MADNAPDVPLTPNSRIAKKIQEGLTRLRAQPPPAATGSSSDGDPAPEPQTGDKRRAQSSPAQSREPSPTPAARTRAVASFNFPAFARSVNQAKRRKTEHASDLNTFAEVRRRILLMFPDHVDSPVPESARFCFTTFCWRSSIKSLSTGTKTRTGPSQRTLRCA